MIILQVLFRLSSYLAANWVPNFFFSWSVPFGFNMKLRSTALFDYLSILFAQYMCASVSEWSWICLANTMSTLDFCTASIVMKRAPQEDGEHCGSPVCAVRKIDTTRALSSTWLNTDIVVSVASNHLSGPLLLLHELALLSRTSTD